jgi:outer membrane protein, multidrug efflux system
MKPVPITRIACLLSLLSIAGCGSTESLLPAKAPIPAEWHATLPHQGMPAKLVKWWWQMGDPSLAALIELAEADSPTVALAVANIEKARASLAAARAGLFPAVNLSSSQEVAGAVGDATSASGGSSTSYGGLDASWELDLFNKTRERSKAAQLRLDQRVDDWNDARVSLAAEVAEYYVQFLACSQVAEVYRKELVSQKETVRVTRTASVSGFSSTADLALAKASEESTASALIAQGGDCEVIIKSLTQVAGGDEPEVRRLLAVRHALPAPAEFMIAAVPADALRQRPDIRALEKALAASVADMGAAKADLYPSFSLEGSITISSSTLTGAALPWSFGPELTFPFLDGGARRAALQGTVADYGAAVANYRSGVLSAISEVETALVRINATGKRVERTTNAARNYASYFSSVDANWRAGGTNLLDREEARRLAQAAEISLIQDRRDAVLYWIALYKALGGGWSGDTDSMASLPEQSKQGSFR